MTQTHFDYFVDPDTGDITFKGQVSRADIRRLDFSPLDLAVLREPVNSPSAAAQNLEVIFRALERQVGRDELRSGPGTCQQSLVDHEALQSAVAGAIANGSRDLYQVTDAVLEVVGPYLKGA